jgi:hypothetical protein
VAFLGAIVAQRGPWPGNDEDAFVHSRHKLGRLWGACNCGAKDVGGRGRHRVDQRLALWRIAVRVAREVLTSASSFT